MKAQSFRRYEKGEYLYVVLVAAWIEYQSCVIAQGHRLEQGEIAVCPHGLLEDVVVLHLLLVYGKNSTDGVANVVAGRAGAWIRLVQP